VLGAFHAFLQWLIRRGDLDKIPEFPRIPVDKHSPTIISAKTQDSLLGAIPYDRRGAFLIAARLGVRPGEIRALDIDDYRDGWITIAKAVKGPNAHAPTRGTRNRKVRQLPVPEDLKFWIEWRLSQITPQERLNGPVALFQNPSASNPQKRWTANSLRKEWNRAAARIGVPVKMYEGTKHAFASDALARGISLHRVQDFLGHQDARSTERYAKLADSGRLDVLRRPVDLSLGCRPPEMDDKISLDSRHLWRGGRDSNPQLLA